MPMAVVSAALDHLREKPECGALGHMTHLFSPRSATETLLSPGARLLWVSLLRVKTWKSSPCLGNSADKFLGWKCTLVDSLIQKHNAFSHPIVSLLFSTARFIPCKSFQSNFSLSLTHCALRYSRHCNFAVDAFQCI